MSQRHHLFRDTLLWFTLDISQLAHPLCASRHVHIHNFYILYMCTHRVSKHSSLLPSAMKQEIKEDQSGSADYRIKKAQVHIHVHVVVDC